MTEENAKTLIDEQVRELGWNLTNFNEIQFSWINRRLS